ncbi:MAG TPA: hypothetical protein VHB25_08540 [Gemmatimonadaceae bacterium]|nr:hypothetical protein [Gemmatimonadaceae bacterium]
MSTTTTGPKGPRNLNTAIAGGVILRGTAVKRGADQNTAVQATANSDNLGIAADYQDTAGRTFSYHGPGSNCEVRTGAAVALDALLASDANGKLITATTGQHVTAIAREAATAADQLIAAETAPRGMVAP